jgi:hypothetical protein
MTTRSSIKVKADGSLERSELFVVGAPLPG